MQEIETISLLRKKRPEKTLGFYSLLIHESNDARNHADLASHDQSEGIFRPFPYIETKKAENY